MSSGNGKSLEQEKNPTYNGDSSSHPGSAVQGFVPCCGWYFIEAGGANWTNSHQRGTSGPWYHLPPQKPLSQQPEGSGARRPEGSAEGSGARRALLRPLPGTGPVSMALRPPRGTFRWVRPCVLTSWCSHERGKNSVLSYSNRE